MRTGQRVGVLAACVAVALGVAYVAGSQEGGSSAPPAAVGTVALGPEPGQPVADYLAGLAADLPAPGSPVLALVQFTAAQSPAETLALTTTTPPVVAVWRVTVPRVQTALRFEPLEPQVPAATALDSTRTRAAAAAAATAARTTGRQQASARVEAAALADPACACVLAVVVRGDRAALSALAAAPAVRAVQAAPAGVDLAALALSPLLPEQVTRADPPPDDGPVPQP